MELLYIWIDKFRNIENKGYNFSNQYDIFYNKDDNNILINCIDGNSAISIIEERLIINTEPNYLKNFFPGNISNVNAIIGKNSTGKSNVLDFLLTAIHKGNRIKLPCDYFLLFQDNNELKFSGRINRQSLNKSILKCSNKEIKKIEPNNEWFSIFYSNVADDRNHLFGNHITHNFSFNKVRKSQSNKLEYVSSEDFDLTWKSITNNTENEQMIRFVLDPVVFNKVRTINNGRIPDAIYKRYNKAIYQESPSNSNRYKYTLTISLFCYMYQKGHIGIEKLDTIRVLTGSIAENIANLQPKIRRILSNIQIDDFLSEEICFNSQSEYQLFLDFIDVFDTNTSRFGNLEKNNNLVIVDYDHDFKSIIDRFIPLFDLTDIIRHDWSGLSSGMKAYLSLYSQLFFAKKEINKNPNKSLIICIDEGDLYMHPEWQRNFLNDLLKFINYNFSNNCIQVLLTSHSPFLISDLPKENVLLLDKEGVVNRQLNEASSFGANIHQLFANQFFLAEKGTTGAFAKEKIIALNKRITNMVVDDLKEIENLIEMIGEPILRYRLEQKLKEHIEEHFGNEDKINWHRNQLLKLGVQ